MSNKKENSKEKETQENEAISGGEAKAAETAADRLEDVISSEKTDPEKKQQPEPEMDEEDKPAAPKKKKEHKKLRHGALSTVYTIIFLAAIVMLNIVAGILFERFPLKLDLTKSGMYSISEESENFVKTIDTDVTIKVFAKEDSFVAINDYSKQANEVIKRITEFNNKIKAEYIDIDSNPDIVSEYSDQTITAYSIIVETLSKDADGNAINGDDGKPLKRVRQISLLDLISFKDDIEQQLSTYYGMSAEDYVLKMTGGDETSAFARAVQGDIVEASTADQAFVSALMSVTDPHPVSVCILTGRKESDDLAYLRKLLTANGYSVSDVNITSEDIPEDADLCIVPAPSVDYMEAEITKLDNYVSNDGKMGHNLIYLASYNQQNTPNLDEFLEEYGLSVGKGLICESDKNYYYTQPFWTVAGDISGSFAGDIPADAAMIFFGSRPVKLLFEGEKGKITTEALVKSTANAYVANETDGMTLENGQQIYAAMSTKIGFSDDGKTAKSNVFVTGCDKMMADDYLRIEQYQNRSYTLNLINSMTGKTSSGLTIAPKVIKGNIFDITAEQIRTLKIVFVGVIPAVTLAIGLFIWIRRKNR